jgi:hypothetical protein
MIRSQIFMMGTHRFFARKKPAQAMAEFAIALPVLLLLLYGIIEAGRLLFIYSTVVTASRQAVRYGTTTGDGGGATPVYGVPRATVPRYNDCAGIRGAANAAGFLSGSNGFDNISMVWDVGPGSLPADIHSMCTAGTPTEVSGTPSAAAGDLDGNSTRLVVTVTENFLPLLPKLVPFAARPITATSARTILYSVAIVVEQPPIIVPQSPTTTLITSHLPNPSEMGQTVTVTVRVVDQDDATNIPEGEVEVSGADNPCIIMLSSGTGSCTVTFSTSGIFPLVGVYTPNDDDHLPSVSDPSDPTAQHTVQAATTVTTIIADPPDPSLRNQDVEVAVTVTGGSTTPTGTVDIDGGGSARCTINLAGGAGGCTINFNNLGAKTITAIYNGDASHQSSADTEPHDVLEGTATPSLTPLPTLSPTSTPMPTATVSPTPIPTAVSSCAGITHGPITYAGNQMSMTITNPFGFPLVMKDVTVTWNDDKGHKTGSDKRLRLRFASVNGATIWSGDITNQSTYSITATPTFNPGINTITFTFHQSYDNAEITDRILINWLTPGCESNPVNSDIP